MAWVAARDDAAAELVDKVLTRVVGAWFPKPPKLVRANHSPPPTRRAVSCPG